MHHTPKHGSWPNMAEIQISNLTDTGLKEMTASQGQQAGQTKAREGRGNAAAGKVRRHLATGDALSKLSGHYPQFQ
jgi:hypothetical protein